MNLRDLEYLVAVADHGSLRRAAVACAVTQPTLSAQLKKLEVDLGADLLDRSASSIRLTAVGEEVVTRARRLLADAAELREAARPHAEGEAAAVRLGVFPTLGAYLLPSVLAGVRERLPEVELLLTERKTTSLLRMLDAGELDAVVAALPVARPDVEVLPLFREDFLLVAPRGHALAGGADAVGDAVSPGELADVEVILLTEGHCLADQVGEWLATIGGRPRADYRASSLESLRSVVAAGAGVTLLPALALQAGGPFAEAIVARPIGAPVPSRELALVWRRASSRSALLRRLGAALVPVGVPHVTPLGATPDA